MNAAKKQPRPPHTPQAFISLKRALQALMSPPSVSAIEPTYHAVRQNQILKAVTKHFGKIARHPAPLLEKDMLDVGCGVAPLGCNMALAGAEVTAIDPNAAALKAARQYAESYGTPLTFINTTAEKLLTDPQRYDVILLLDVLAEHNEPGKLLWVLKQLLNPGGMLIIGHTTHTLRAWFFHIFLSRIVHKRVGGRLSWRRFHRPHRLADLAAAAGLQQVGVDNLRYSLNSRAWKMAHKGRSSTRYLAYYKAA